MNVRTPKTCGKCGGPLGGTITNTSAVKCIHGKSVRRHCCECHLRGRLV